MTRQTAWTTLLAAALGGALLFGVHSYRRALTEARPSTEPVLRKGVTIEHELPAGTSRRYRLTVDADRFLKLEVEQRNVDAILRLFAPDGSFLIESDGVNGRQGPEYLSLVADRAGVYTLEVLAPADPAETRSGTIATRVIEQGPASRRNRVRAAADWRAARGRQFYYERSQESYLRARQELAAAASEFRAARDTAGEADSLFLLAVVIHELERFDETLQPLDRALELARSLSDRRREADILWMRGWSYGRLGEWSNSIDDLSQALPLFRALGDPAREARALCRLAGLYLEMGNTTRGHEYASTALQLTRTTADPREMIEALNALGSSYLFQRKTTEAAPLFEEALELARSKGYREAEMGNLISLGVTFRLMGRQPEARARLDEAMALAKEYANRFTEAGILEQMAATYDPIADPTARRLMLERALEASRATGDDRALAAISSNLAIASLEAGDLERALRLSEEAVAAREQQWQRAPNTALQVGYLAEQYADYEVHLDVLAAIDRAGADSTAAARAFSLAEGVRARALRQQLARAQVEVQAEVPRALLERRRDLARAVFAEEMAKRAGRGSPGRLDELEADLRRLERQIAKASPRWAELMLPAPIAIDELQRELLDDETVLLEYSLGKRRSHVFVVGPATLSIVELPPRAAIEDAARAVSEAVIARNQRPRFETASERKERVAASDHAFASAAQALTEMVLTPTASAIAGKRLALVADGALQYVPFGALPDPTATSEGAREPLAFAHEIVQLPSASVLRDLRRPDARTTRHEATLAVLADPILHADDPRLKRWWREPIAVSLGRGVGAAPVPTAVPETQWPDLPYAREEAETILAFVPASERFAAFGQDASRERVVNLDLSRYRVVHFATHIWLDDEQADSTGIVLSQFDQRGRAQNGLLSLFDIYELRLPVDLVVLSGCRTALGKEIRGEGLIGLTRGFMFAGAPRVVVSLWDVQDRATAELMKRFYAALLVDGQRPAEALRSAQREMAGTAEWSAPYHWAGFVLQGDWQ